MEHRKPWLRVIAMIMILLILPQQIALAAPTTIVQAQPGSGSTATTTKNANLYQKKDSGSKVLKKIDAGKSVSVISKTDSWIKAKFEGKTGFIKASAFAQLKAKEKSAQPGTQMIVVTHDAKLYKKASGSSSSIGVVRKAEVLVISQSGNWCKVSVDGKTGYMKASAFTATALKKTKRYQKAEAKGTAIEVKKGAKLTILGWGKEWTKVIHNKKKGYIKTAHIEFPKAASATDQITEKLSAKSAATPSPTATMTAKATTTMQAASTTYMYQKASTSAKRVKVKKGATVVVSKTTKNWAQVKVSGKGGYMKISALVAPAQATAAPTPSPTPKPTATPATYSKLKQGSKGTKVKNLQTALEALGYLDFAPNGKYASTTTAAVREFQGRAGIKKTGIADNKTQIALYGSSAPKSSILSSKLQPGDKGTKVKRMQARLRTLGYYKNTVNSKFTASTKTAVEKFQRQAGITVDGIAGAATLSKLFAPNAPKYDANAVAATPTPTPTATPRPTTTPKPTATPAPAPTSSASSKQKIEQMIEVAMNQLGKPYVFATSGPNTFDCSGFIVYSFKQIGMVMPHSAYQMGYQVGTKVTRSQLKRGDLVFWNTISDSDLCDHVGIYLGNGQAIHASSGTGRVIISSIDSGYYYKNFSWGRSVL